MKGKMVPAVLLVASTVFYSLKPAAASELLFFDDFDGLQVDTEKWAVIENTDWSGYPAYGGSVTVENSQLSLSSSGSGFPYVTAVGNPFPASGDFVLEFNMTYTCISDWGNGIWVSKGPYEVKSENGTNNQLIFYLWADNYSFDECWIHANLLDGDYVYTSVLKGWEPSAPPHVFRLEYSDGTYQLSVDGEKVASKPSRLRPDTIGFGHPQCYYIPFSPEHVRSVIGGWGSLSIDYIKVDASSSSGINAQNGAYEIFLSTSVESQQIGYKIDITGNLNLNGVPAVDKQVILWYEVPGVSTWYPITSTTTDADGAFSANWISTATGTFTIKAEYTDGLTGEVFSKTANISVTEIPSGSFYMSVESNSTLSAVSFNSTSNEFYFTVSGPTGTTGCTMLSVPKGLMPNLQPKIYIDGQQVAFNSTSTDDAWVLSLNYGHSTHDVVLKLDESAQNNQLFIGVAAAFVIGFCVVLTLALTRTLSKPKTAQTQTS